MAKDDIGGKTMKKILCASILLLSLIFVFAGCTSGLGDRSGLSGKPESAIGGLEPGEDEQNYQIQPGQLTAAEWNDNDNYQFWKTLFFNQSGNGPFYRFLEQFSFDSLHRVTVNVTFQEEPVANAVVELLYGETVLYTARSDAKGNAYLFPDNIVDDLQYTIRATSADSVKTREIVYSDSPETVSIALDNAEAKRDRLELMFVMDTTGSMSDELEYIKSEIQDVIGRVKSANTETDIYVALLFYRDIGDEYITRYFDFSTDIDKQQSKIATQRADGGGDYPEAVDAALNEAVSKQWSNDSTTRLIIHVLDAPPHDEPQNMQTFAASVYDAAEKGIRLIPVASSGVDEMTEYLLRSEAMLTGGTYVFLTDDSGIGGDHLEPKTGDYVVEYLNDLLVRVINEYHTGIETEPIPYNQK